MGILSELKETKGEKKSYLHQIVAAGLGALQVMQRRPGLVVQFAQGICVVGPVNVAFPFAASVPVVGAVCIFAKGINGWRGSGRDTAHTLDSRTCVQYVHRHLMGCRRRSALT